MTYVTEERLKSHLDTNQLKREQLCLSILKTDKRFSNIRPRHPRGGPDGGRDIDATFEGTQKTFCAVGFVNQANDSDKHKKAVKKKFKEDLATALGTEPALDVFVFFTNVNLTVSEKDNLVAFSSKGNIGYCEIFDRERMRICLDSPDGMSIRFQYLGIALSETEQAAFFARWGEDIQNVINEGFGQVQKVLNRLQFLYESEAVLSQFVVLMELDREYDATEIGHFRFFSVLTLNEPRSGILGVIFGITDNPDRPKASKETDLNPAISGVENGMSGIHLEHRVSNPIDSDNEDVSNLDDIQVEYITRSTMSSVGRKSIHRISAQFGYGDFFRVPPYIKFKDIDNSMITMFINASLVSKIKSFTLIGNEYKIYRLDRSMMSFDKFNTRFHAGMVFSTSELEDDWVRVMGSRGGLSIRFSELTPKRFIDPDEVAGGLTDS
ncbi:MAG: hypothetical protein IID61_11725 [SAR324 cluster bacterium]|nr:hypothetical protein [SAR324 cluster bacterium]